jgi:hypothetical protein
VPAEEAIMQDPRLHEKLSGKTAMGDGTLKICLDAEPKVKGAKRRSSQVKETGDMWVRKPAYPFLFSENLI